MISRRRILSKSRDDLNLDSGVGFPVQVEEEEDVWYNKEKLYKVRYIFFRLSHRSYVVRGINIDDAFFAGGWML